MRSVIEWATTPELIPELTIPTPAELNNPDGEWVVMVPVTEIMQKLKCTVDEFYPAHTSEWFRMMIDKCGDSKFATLVRLIMKNGFTDSLSIMRIDDDTWELGNGHHRLCAAILLGLDEVPVVFGTYWSVSGNRRNVLADEYDYQNDAVESAWIAQFIGKSEDNDWVYSKAWG